LTVVIYRGIEITEVVNLRRHVEIVGVLRRLA
jgi:hypothetical protein